MRRRTSQVVVPLIAALAVGWGALLSRATISAQTTAGNGSSAWIEAGKGGRLPDEMTFANPEGRLGVLMTSGPMDTQGHPFFTPLGSNGRACVTCHQPANAMSLSVAALRERWRVTGGRDPVFAAIDGSNNPQPAAGQRELALAAAQSRLDSRRAAVAAAVRSPDARSRPSSPSKSSAIRPASTSMRPMVSRAASRPSRCSAGRGPSPISST